MSTLLRALLGVLLLSFVPALLADNYSFNPAYIGDCLAANATTACSFSNATLWVNANDPNATNATLPGPADAVTILSPQPLLLTLSYPAQFASLVLANASLLVAGNASLTLTSALYLDVGATLTVGTSANVTTSTPNATFTLTPSASLLVSAGGSFTWYGKSAFFGTVEVAANSEFVLQQAKPFAPFDMTFASLVQVGYLWVTGSCVFGAGVEVFSLITAPDVFVTIGVSFTGSLFLDQGALVAFGNMNFSLNDENSGNPISGPGTLSITESTGVINSETPSTFNGTLTISGTSSVILINLTLPNLMVDPNVTIYANGVVLSGNNATLQGQIIAQQNGLTISGSPYTANVVVNSTLTVSGVFFPTSLQLNNGSTVNLAGGLIHSTVTIPPQTSLSVTSSGQIVGSLVNQGSLNVTTTNSLEIWSGDYAQDSGTFSVVLDKTDQPALNVVNGSIFLNGGGIQFSIKDKPFLKNANFLVAQANASLNGTFTGDASPLQGSEITRNLAVNYQQNPNAIYIKYSFDVKDVEYWMWIVLGVVVALILVVVVAVVVKCRKRTKYESLHS